jgi:nucleoside-diphosphate-sugar epimerase
MRILVTGGTGIIGQQTVGSLLRRGHEVTLVSRNAARDAERFGAGVVAWPATVTEPEAVAGSSDRCDVVIHIAGIAREEPPELTFERVNVEGTRNLLREAARSGVRRFVYVSSLGADRGVSDYHRSKRASEELVRQYAGEWVIVRPGNVYGAGDEVLSTLLEWVRTSPVVPVIGTGAHVFQPIWCGDVAAAFVAVAEREDVVGRVLQIAGPDRTTLDDMLDRLVRLTGRRPVRVPVPAAAVSAGIAAAAALGVDLPVTESQLQMLLEGNVIPDDAENALTERLGLAATSLDEGLRMLATATPEQLPDEGFGPMHVRVFAAEAHTDTTEEQLIARVRNEFSRLMPGTVEMSPESGADSATRLYEGATLTMSLPVRGHIQVRVAEVSPTGVTLLTLRGHPLAGAVRFRARRQGELLRFEVQVIERAASIADFALMALGGSVLQGKTWEDFVRNAFAAVAAKPGLVTSSTEALDDERAARVRKWLSELSLRSRGSGRIPGLRGATGSVPRSPVDNDSARTHGTATPQPDGPAES